MKNFIKPNNRTLIPFWLFFCLGVLLIVYGGYLEHSRASLSSSLSSCSSSSSSLSSSFPPSVKATSYLVGRIDTGKILAEKNDSLQVFPASLSKLMTAMVVRDNISLDKRIFITPYAVSTEGDEGGLEAGETLLTRDLLAVLLIPSSNDAATAFSQAFTKEGKNLVDLMRKKAERLHLYNTAFFDATGLDRQGNFTTAEDLFKLASDIYKNYPLLGKITRKKEITVYSFDKKHKHLLKNTNKLIGKLPYFWGGKTGSTPEAKDCLLTIYDFPSLTDNVKIPVVIIILHSSARFLDTEKLYQWTKKSFNTQEVTNL